MTNVKKIANEIFKEAYAMLSIEDQMYLKREKGWNSKTKEYVLLPKEAIKFLHKEERVQNRGAWKNVQIEHKNWELEKIYKSLAEIMAANQFKKLAKYYLKRSKESGERAYGLSLE